jgi:TRAP-type C4-dicarboxylate transport system substrate-binding protein
MKRRYHILCNIFLHYGIKSYKGRKLQLNKKLLLIPLALLLALSLMAISCPSTPTTTPSEEPIVIKYGSSSGEDYWAEIYGHKIWRDDVEEATGGKVIFEEYYSETLLKSADVWSGIKSGVADMTYATHVSLPGVCPLSEVVTLPFLPFKSSAQASGILWKLYEEFPSIRAEYEDLHVTHFVVGLGNHIISTSKLYKTLDDFEGEKIRATGGSLAPKQLELLGAVPLSMPFPEVYLNFQKGVMDGVVGNWDFTTFARLYEIGEYYTYVPINAFFISSPMNKDKWNSLPPDIQQIINEQSGLWRCEATGYSQFDSAFDRAKEKIQNEGFQMIEYTVPQDELDKWIEVAGLPLWDVWVQEMTAKGHPEAQQILDRMLELIETYEPSPH